MPNTRFSQKATSVPSVSAKASAAKAVRETSPKVPVNSSPVSKVTKKQPKSPKQPPKKLKEHIEQSFAHIEVPKDLALPPSFIEFHTPEFVDGIRHVLDVDPTLYPAIVYDNFATFAKEKEELPSGTQLIHRYWFSLISSVISQQVSGAAAKAIQGRFVGLFKDEPTPHQTLQVPLDILKGVGLSNMKVKYVVHISETFCSEASRLTSPDFYKQCSSEELISELVKLKGIGEWSAKMFSTFTLKQMDIFAHDDLGVARGVARYLQVRSDVLKEVKAGVDAVETLKMGLKKRAKFHSDKSKRDWVPVHDEYVKYLALKFSPYRSAFMVVMWRLSSTNIAALEND